MTAESERAATADLEALVRRVHRDPSIPAHVAIVSEPTREPTEPATESGPSRWWDLAIIGFITGVVWALCALALRGAVRAW